MSRKTLEELLQLLIDGQIEESDRIHLLGILKSDPDALELYCQYAELDASLHQQVKTQTALGEEQKQISRIGRQRTRRRNFQFTALAAAAALILLGVILRLTFVPDTPALLTYRTSADTELTLTHDPTAKKAPAPGTLAKGSRAVLTQGTAEFNFHSGIRAIVQAPADLTVHDDDQIFLNEGTAWFHVPTEAIGFQVRTSELLATDLGTDFGVFSAHNQLDEVQVFTGKVQIDALRGLKTRLLATTGQAHRVDPAGRIVPIPLQPTQYLTTLPNSLPHIHLSFDSLSGDSLTATGTHPAVSKLHPRLIKGSSQSLVPGKSGNALALHGKGDFIDTDWYGFEGIRPRTVTFWTKISEGAPLPSLPAIVGWGEPGLPDNSKFKILVSPENPQHEYRPRISFGGNFWFDGTTDLKDGQWHHVAVTFSGKRRPDNSPDISIYIDGKPESLTNRSLAPNKKDAFPYTETKRTNSCPLRIGKGVGNYQHTFPGLLDELIIYDGVLSEKSLQKLIKTHKP